MRASKTVLALLTIAAVAVAQDSAPAPLPAATGELLLAAMPDRADLLVHTPDLPALLASTDAAGIGGDELWAAAFRAQLEHWGAASGSPERLVDGGEALLRAADGEALVASLRLPPIGGPSRATLLALRSSRRESELRKALLGVLEGGLAGLYSGVPRQEQVQSRPVTVLTRPEGRLYISVQDGLVAVADHPLALGLLFRGLESAGEPKGPGEKRLEVRYGRGKERWTGWMYGDRESVSWKAPNDVPLVAHVPDGPRVVVAVATVEPEDSPLLPAPPPAWIVDLDPTPGHADAVVLLDDGEAAACIARLEVSTGQPPFSVVVRPESDVVADDLVPGAKPVAGGASHVRWLRAYATGTLALPLPGIDGELLAPIVEQAEAALDSARPFHAWTVTEQSGEVRGPAWHGPTTMLALRTLHDLSRRRDPGPAVVRGDGGAPLPTPGVHRPLPPPTEDREAPLPEDALPEDRLPDDRLPEDREPPPREE